jgi:cystathionine beta-synthase
MVLADPQGSALTEYVHTGQLGKSGPSVVEGIGSGQLPAIGDFSRVRDAFQIPDAESLETARLLLKRAGILAGSSSGTLVAAALRYCRRQTAAKRVVSFICDSGNKYLSKMFNDYWMMDQGFITRPRQGDLRDLITRRYAERAVITVAPDDPLLTAFQRMRMADVSQVPVMHDGQAIGILDESDVLMSVQKDPEHFHQPVRTAMTTKLETLPVSASLEEVVAVLDRGLVALVVENGGFVGLITRTDFITHLRRKLNQ